MNKQFIPGNVSLEQLDNIIQTLEGQESVESVLIFSADKSKLNKPQFDPLLTKTSLNVLGGVFPQVIYEGKNYEEGTVIVALGEPVKTLTIDNFEYENVEQRIEKHFEGFNPNQSTIFLFVDALVSEKQNVTDAIYNLYGTVPKYVGGGTGSLEFKPFPCVYTNQGIQEGVMVIGACNIVSQVGVAHGYDTLGEPLKVTEAEGNKIISLDWKPAVEVYTEIVEQHSGKDFNFEDFFNSVKSYPFGVGKLDSEMVVRDPFAHEDGALLTLDTIESGSYVNVLFGNKENLFKGAREASQRASTLNSNTKATPLIIDCISRALFLGEELDEELSCLDPDKSGFGALTLGEIANNGDAYLEVYNKTSVVCNLYEKA